MIRIETENDWLLLTHPDHAALAGEFARHWKNGDFAPPEPFIHILDACTRHDDSWGDRDAKPLLTREMNPSAFSEELVGTYDAFEEIDLDDYLRVRGEATEAAALRDPYAAVLISMHTVNLLTVQADLSTLNAEETVIHSAFIEGQLKRQAELKAQLRALPDIAPLASDEQFEKGFRFLQACDSFSLYAGVAFSKEGKLQHPHPMRDGTITEIKWLPQGDNHYILDPYPLDEPVVEFQIPYRRVAKAATASLETYQAAYAAAPVELVTITVSKK
ncbi:DUF3891 family protein [Coraliomargarita parva]|uniref:DUF3891 family protein n=1 Tax=Coraliomargarita parva TaxID=3014050 RepID=UPI0022B3EEC1|nr:DUF3891 family protein [Coraliomargarita parva]